MGWWPRPASLWPLVLLAACRCGPADTDTDTDTDGSVTDPLSMPATPTVDASAFTSASACRACHPTQFAQWSGSNHAYAMVDPLFQRLVELRQAQYDGLQDRFCTQCHSAIGVRSGSVGPGFAFDGQPDVVREGVTCDACHRATAIARDHNSGLVLDPDAPEQGPITDPDGNAQHGSQASAIFADAEFCGSCHDVVELNGLPLERPYQEWLESPAYMDGRTCQDCHMTASTGPAAVNGADRTVHDHRFIGVDTPLLASFAPDPTDRADREARVAALLADVAAVDVAAAPVTAGETLDLVVTVTNRVDGHDLPTGTTFIRQLWLEVTATDADGNALFTSGDLDANGDLRDAWSDLDPYGDADLIAFRSGLYDAQGEPTLFPWNAYEHFTTAIPPGYARTVTYFVPTEGAAEGAVHVDVRLRFRAIPPYLLRAVGMDDVIDEVPVRDLASAALDVTPG